MTQILNLLFVHVSNWKRLALYKMFPFIGNPYPLHLETFPTHLEASPIHLETLPIHLETPLPLVFFVDKEDNSNFINLAKQFDYINHLIKNHFWIYLKGRHHSWIPNKYLQSNNLRYSYLQTPRKQLCM